MFDHVKFGVSDYAASKAFFLKALEPLGVTDVEVSAASLEAAFLALTSADDEDRAHNPAHAELIGAAR